MATTWFGDYDTWKDPKPRRRALIELSSEALHKLLQLPDDMRIVTAFADDARDVLCIKVEAPYLPLKHEGQVCINISLEDAQAGVAGAIARDLIDNPQ